MAKVTVTFERKIEVGGKVFEGDMEVEKPNTGVLMDAGSIADPSNQVAFTVAIMGVVLDVPLNTMRSLEIEDFAILKRSLESILPKM